MPRRRTHKTLAEMTRAELETLVEAQYGIPVPPVGAPAEDWRRWHVACRFVGAHRLASGCPELGDWMALAELREEGDFAACIPYIEQALGRPLCADEKDADGRIPDRLDGPLRAMLAVIGPIAEKAGSRWATDWHRLLP